MTPEPREALLTALAIDREGADLTPPDRAMLDYVVKLTLTPGDIGEADVDALRAHGFDDRGIHDICAITAYYAFVNRMADGLGVELEPDRSDTLARGPGFDGSGGGQPDGDA
jgi:uncharacterized peroxidase-related enzyme